MEAMALGYSHPVHQLLGTVHHRPGVHAFSAVMERPHRRHHYHNALERHRGRLVLDRPASIELNDDTITIGSDYVSDKRLLTGNAIPQTTQVQACSQISQETSPNFLAVTTEEKPQRTRNKERTPDFFANVGDAIRTLREDIPNLFYHDLNYAIYRDDIVFADPRNKLEGIKNYKLLFWSLRFHGRLFFSSIYVEIKRIWQPQDDLIKMRWTVHGVPRVPWYTKGIFDGISSYKLDNAGRVYEHQVDNVLLRDPPAVIVNPFNLVSLAQQQQQQPCPGAWFLPLAWPHQPHDEAQDVRGGARAAVTQRTSDVVCSLEDTLRELGAEGGVLAPIPVSHASSHTPSQLPHALFVDDASARRQRRAFLREVGVWRRRAAQAWGISHAASSTSNNNINSSSQRCTRNVATSDDHHQSHADGSGVPLPPLVLPGCLPRLATLPLDEWLTVSSQPSITQHTISSCDTMPALSVSSWMQLRVASVSSEPLLMSSTGLATISENKGVMSDAREGPWPAGA